MGSWPLNADEGVASTPLAPVVTIPMNIGRISALATDEEQLAGAVLVLDEPR